MQEIETRAAKHLPLQHFEAVDVPLDRAIGPRQGHARFDGRIVVAEPTGKAAQGLQRTCARPRQPWIQMRGLPLAHHLRKVLRQVHRLSNLDRVRVELRELLGLGLCALRGASQDQPRRPAGCQGLGDRLRHHREDLAPALAAGGMPCA